MKISIVGSGNMAHFLSRQLYAKGHRIVNVYSRNIENAINLARLYQAKALASLYDMTHDSDVYIVATNDEVIGEIAQSMSGFEKIWIHCSGTKSMDALLPASSKIGVIWSVYSINKNFLPPIDYAVPLMIQASDSVTEKTILLLAKDISDKVQIVEEQQRKMMHLCAVIANNFTNHLLALAQDICMTNKLPFSFLRPIIEQTFSQANKNGVFKEFQTGPAIRQDLETQNQHLQLLSDNPGLQDLYQMVSRSIVEMKNI